MTAPSVIRSGVGLRDVQIFALDANGYPAATSTTAYAGIDVSGVRNVTINDPEPRQISHFGDDRIFALDVLPPTEPLTGEMVVSKTNDTVDAALTGNKSITVGEAKLFGVNTDLKGSENQVAIIAYQQSLDTDPAAATFGKRVWEFKVMPRAWIIPRENSLDENPTARTYTLRPNFVTQHVWGTAFAVATEGFTQAQLLRGVSEYKPRIVSFKGDGSTTTFAVGETVVSTAKYVVWDNGVTSTTFTGGTTSIVFSPAPTSGHMIVAYYEVANTSGD